MPYLHLAHEALLVPSSMWPALRLSIKTDLMNAGVGWVDGEVVVDQGLRPLLPIHHGRDNVGIRPHRR